MCCGDALSAPRQPFYWSAGPSFGKSGGATCLVGGAGGQELSIFFLRQLIETDGRADVECLPFIGSGKPRPHGGLDSKGGGVSCNPTHPVKWPGTSPCFCITPEEAGGGPGSCLPPAVITTLSKGVRLGHCRFA